MRGALPVVLALLLLSTASAAFARQAAKLPRPRRLDRDLEFRRDAATGELYSIPAKAVVPGTPEAPAAGTVRATVTLVEVNCNVLSPHGTHLRSLGRDDFRLFEGGVEQRIAHFDAASEPASIALLMDASPSVFRELEEMKAAARALARNLSPLDEVAVVAFAGQTHLLLPFSRDRALLERTVGSVELMRSASETGSNIYQAIYLTVRELFRGRTGRKAIVVLTDGQDSGLGLSWDPATAAPHPGEKANRLTFEDVSRALAAAGVEVYAVSTQNRPKAMTEAWLAAHQGDMLINPAARELGMVHYTLYLAELVRRAGGHLYFLREIGTLSEVYRRIAETLDAEYTLGYYPSAGLAKPGWRALRVELAGHADAGLATQDTYAARRDARPVCRVAYYFPANP